MSAALIEAARAALEALLLESTSPPIPETAAAIADLRTALAAAEQPAEPVPTGWDGTEEWEALAWHLCAEENGEDACNELVWEGGPMPEPWGDRWLKYEGPAKDMIAKVRKFASPTAPAQAPLTDEQLSALILATVYDGDERIPYRDYWTRDIGEPFARAIERAHGIGSKA